MSLNSGNYDGMQVHNKKSILEFRGNFAEGF